ncbi:hypothetical protein LTR51_002215 [Lithohypha guttulata]|nr:hypothetical protein LTR51_002215 [Lithohypha guttulata]
MARLRGIQVLIQQACPQNTWSSLEETDLEDSVKDMANSAARWSTGVEASSGLFRFLVVVEKGFEWKGATGLEIILTFDDGYLLNDYRTLAIRPENASHDMDVNPGIHPMSERPPDGCLQLELSNVVLPWPEDLSRSEYRQASFSFETLNRTQRVTGNNSKRRESFSDIGMLKVQITPVFIRPASKDTHIAHNSNSDYQAHETSLMKAKPGVSLKAGLQWGINPVQGVCAYSGGSFGVKKRTFMFFYREDGRYVKVPESEIEVQDEDDRTAGRFRASSRATYIPEEPSDQAQMSSVGVEPIPFDPTSHENASVTPENGSYSQIHEILRAFEIESARKNTEKEQLIVETLEDRNAEIRSEQQKLQEQKDELVRTEDALKAELEQNNNRIDTARARLQDVQGGRPSISVDEVEHVFQILRNDRQREAEEELREVEDSVEKARKRRRSALSAGDRPSSHRDSGRFEGRSHKPGNRCDEKKYSSMPNLRQIQYS